MDIVKHPSSDFQFDFFFWEKISTRKIGRFFYFNNIHHAINITTTNLSLYAAGHHKSRRLSGRIRPPFLFFFFQHRCVQILFVTAHDKLPTRRR